MKPKTISNLIFALILLAYVVYAGVYIYQSSFVVNEERYFVLFDDAMISMRYARNLANGDGLVWNPGGERVEGYTNPLWVVFMAIFHLFPIPITKISLGIQISGGLFFIASLYFVKKIAEEISTDTVTIGAFVPLLAVFLTAFHGQLSTWSLLGMEVSVLILITNIAVWRALRGLKRGEFSPWLYVLLGASTLVRVDMLVIHLTILVFLAVADAQHRRKHLLWGVGMLAAFMLAQTLFRVWYYGDPLPNTYYLKVTGAPLKLVLIRGAFVFVKFIWNFNPALFVLPFMVILVRRERATLFLAWVFLSMCAYSVYVGGDAWESKGGANRFISTTLPLFFILFSYSLELIRRALLEWRGGEDAEGQSTGSALWAAVRPFLSVNALTRLGVVAFALVGLVNFNAHLDTSSLKFWLLLKRHPFVPGSERYVYISEVVNEITSEDASIAVVTAGIIPYYAERYTIDLMGKADAVISREPMNIPEDLALIEFRPGHMKWNYAYSITELQPDVVTQIWGGYSNPENLQYLTEYTKVEIDGLPFFLKNGSPHIHWDRVPVGE